ncbi:MAG: DUF4838 domain-containing protein [Candidatus Sumerlaeota bacterium]|nr:DUF4838 domain-containing protein [Candidatus Sumerlaeota bacterium]
MILAVLCAATTIQAATIVVNFGAYQSAALAGSGEARVNWSDADASDDTLCTENFAACELQHYLRAMTGSPEAFPIIDDNATTAGELIVIGGPKSNALVAKVATALDVSQATLEKLGAEGYIIKSALVDGRRVTLVAGGGRVGTLYGVYDLLHRLGVRWYAPGEANEEIPQKPLATLPDISAEETPKFFTRGFHAWENRGDRDFLLWMARNRLNYWCVEQEPKALMHKLGIMMAGGGHVLTDYYLGPALPYPYDHPSFTGDEKKPKDPYPVSSEYQGDANHDGKLTYFEAHPEWYAQRGGKRSDKIREGFGDNFCTSNADAMAEWMKNAVADLAEGRYKDASIINAWMLDVGKWCECGKCKAQGTPTDRNLLFVHAYAQAIKKAQAASRINRPVRLLFLAYSDVLEPPTRALPKDFDYEMCIANYFPIVRCYVHNFDDPKCSKNALYNRHLHGWAMAPNRYYRGQICIGEYYNVSGYKCLPICFMTTMAHDIPVYYNLSARHFHYMHCTTQNWGNKALTNWQMARQLWDPKADCAALWDDYFAGRYGAAQRPMRDFYRNLEAMLSNVSELKYGLARRLQTGAKDLYTTSHLRYENKSGANSDGPSMVEILASAARCREILDGVQKTQLPDRIAQRVAEDERLFTYGERTVKFYDALSRAYFGLRAGKGDDAAKAFHEAEALAVLLKADTASTQCSATHATAPDALDASRAAGALTILKKLLATEKPQGKN